MDLKVSTLQKIPKKTVACGDVLQATLSMYLYKGGEETEMKSRSSQS